MHVVKPSGLGDRASDDPGFVADRSARFAALIQSPLRASLLRHLHQRPEVRFSLDALAQHFARRGGPSDGVQPSTTDESDRAT